MGSSPRHAALCLAPCAAGPHWKPRESSKIRFVMLLTVPYLTSN